MKKNTIFTLLAIFATFYADASVQNQKYATEKSDLSQPALSASDGNVPAPQDTSLKKYADLLEGSWQALDTAGQSIFGDIDFGKKNIRWGHDKASNCSTAYEILSENQGGQLPSYYHSPRTYRQGTKFSIFKIKIIDNHCARTARFLEVARPSDYDVIEIVPFDEYKHKKGLLLFSKS
jgi:hypothetical protein